jgi:hypothetical protein
VQHQQRTTTHLHTCFCCPHCRAEMPEFALDLRHGSEDLRAALAGAPCTAGAPLVAALPHFDAATLFNFQLPTPARPADAHLLVCAAMQARCWSARLASSTAPAPSARATTLAARCPRSLTLWSTWMRPRVRSLLRLLADMSVRWLSVHTATQIICLVAAQRFGMRMTNLTAALPAYSVLLSLPLAPAAVKPLERTGAWEHDLEAREDAPGKLPCICPHCRRCQPSSPLLPALKAQQAAIHATAAIVNRCSLGMPHAASPPGFRCCLQTPTPLPCDTAGQPLWPARPDSPCACCCCGQDLCALLIKAPYA